MALRAIWKGTLRFSLVSVPVEAFAASEAGNGEIHLNQLHDKCHSRIRYKKTCPIHGEVPNNEIVLGYEYEKDKYVVFEPGEIEKKRGDKDRSVAIDTFVAPDEIDPIYFDGRTYYLVPSTDGALKPYAVLSQTMSKLNRYGVATIVLHGKEELVLVRPLEGVLTMTMLYYQSQVRSPKVLQEEIPTTKANQQELKLAQQLIESSTAKRFDFSQYEDKHTQHMRDIIEAKVKGREIVQPPDEGDEVQVINLMDALKKSVQRSKRSPKSKQARKMLTDHLSRPGRSVGRQRRRKSS